MIDYSKRTYAFFIEAKKPVVTTQLMFSENPDYEAAGKEVLAKFDSRFPTATDRKIFRAMEYAAYQKQVNETEELNNYLNF